MRDFKYPKCHDCVVVDCLVVDCGERVKYFPECYIKVSDAPRPIVRAFAKEMEKQLRANEDKGGWEKCSFRFLMSELYHNYGKLRGALDRGDRGEIIRRAANVANFAMMLAENEGKLES